MAVSEQSDLSNSSSWEKVNMLPHDKLNQELEETKAELHRMQPLVRQNTRGVDMTATGEGNGRLMVEVVEAKQLSMEGMLSVTPKLYVACLLTPSKGTDGQKAWKTPTVETPVWKEQVLFHGIKTKKLALKIMVRNASELVADVNLGDVEIPMSDLLDQELQDKWYSLQPSGKIHLRLQFEYDAIQRLQRQVDAIGKKQQEMMEAYSTYEANRQLLQVSKRHPASFGTAAAKSGLYIPGNRFSVDSHHFAAVAKTPFPDKSRVITPFGPGSVIGFRSFRKVYSIKLDNQHPKVAYVHEDQVQEEPEEAELVVSSKVVTPYGEGTIKEIRSGFYVVAFSYGTAYIQKKDAKTPVKKVTEMSEKQKLSTAVMLTAQGNEFFKKTQLPEAVQSYLQSLGYLQYIDQDKATHKEKAEILQTMIRCHLNIGACKLKMEEYTDAITASTNAINILNVLRENRTGKVVEWMGRLNLSDQLLFQDWPSKALFRRAQSYIKTHQYPEAKTDLTNLLSLSPAHKQGRSLYDWVTKKVAAQKKKEKQTWGGIFDKDVPKSQSVPPSRPSNAPTPPVAVATPAPTGVDVLADIAAKKQSMEEEETWTAFKGVALVGAIATIATIAILATHKRS